MQKPKHVADLPLMSKQPNAFTHTQHWCDFFKLPN